MPPNDRSPNQFPRLDIIRNFSHRILHRQHRPFLGNVWQCVFPDRMHCVYDSIFPKGSIMTVLLGLVAALSWGIHDILVRWVSQKSNVFSALFLVLLFGLIIQFGIVAVRGEFAAIPMPAMGAVFAAGIAFMFAGIAIYKAFEIGPVQLVAPIVATYAIGSILLGVAQGDTLTALQILAICAVFIGLYIVVSLANSSDDTTSNGKRSHAILWACGASLGFAVTFGIGQSIVQYGPEMMTILTIRFIAVISLIPIMLYLKAPLFAAMGQWKILGAMGALDALALTSVLVSGNMPNASYASLAASLFGMVTILLAWVFLRERMTPLQWVGVTLTFIGIAYLGGH
jgi:drug/metabolite transporter (DMT)-like permease